MKTINWEEIAKQKGLSEDFIRDHAQNFDWNILIQHQTISESLMKENKHKFMMIGAFQYQKLSEEFIEAFITTMGGPYKVNRLYWDALEKNQQLSESFIEKYEDRWYWNPISQNQKLSFSFIRKHIKRFRNMTFENLVSNPRIVLTEKETIALKILLSE